MDFNGCHMGFHGCSWIFMILNGPQWVSIGFHGFDLMVESVIFRQSWEDRLYIEGQKASDFLRGQVKYIVPCLRRTPIAPSQQGVGCFDLLYGDVIGHLWSSMSFPVKL